LLFADPDPYGLPAIQGVRMIVDGDYLMVDATDRFMAVRHRVAVRAPDPALSVVVDAGVVTALLRIIAAEDVEDEEGWVARYHGPLTLAEVPTGLAVTLPDGGKPITFPTLAQQFKGGVTFPPIETIIAGLPQTLADARPCVVHLGPRMLARLGKIASDGIAFLGSEPDRAVAIVWAGGNARGAIMPVRMGEDYFATEDDVPEVKA
jgi:hypothetical protein